VSGGSDLGKKKNVPDIKGGSFICPEGYLTGEQWGNRERGGEIFAERRRSLLRRGRGLPSSFQKKTLEKKGEGEKRGSYIDREIRLQRGGEKNDTLHQRPEGRTTPRHHETERNSGRKDAIQADRKARQSWGKDQSSSG